MKLGILNKLTVVISFVLHILHPHITHLAVNTRITTIKLEKRRGGKSGKEPDYTPLKVQKFNLFKSQRHCQPFNCCFIFRFVPLTSNHEKLISHFRQLFVFAKVQN